MSDGKNGDTNSGEAVCYNFTIRIIEDDGEKRIVEHEDVSEKDALAWATLGQEKYPQSAEVLNWEKL